MDLNNASLHKMSICSLIVESYYTHTLEEFYCVLRHKLRHRLRSTGGEIVTLLVQTRIQSVGFCC